MKEIDKQPEIADYWNTKPSSCNLWYGQKRPFAIFNRLLNFDILPTMKLGQLNVRN